MEAAHVVILRKNLVYLKEHLEVGEVLDHLYQEGIFTLPECNRCKQAGPDKCGTVLEILMEKGEEGYKSLCAVLDRSQPHVKEQLDRTSSKEGATSLLFVNKLKLEQRYKDAIAEKDRTISILQDENSALKEELDTNKEELEAAKTAREEDRERHLAELGEEKDKCETIIEKERQEIENVKAKVEELEEEAKRFKVTEDHLKNALSDEKERYEAITGLTKLQEPGNVEGAELTGQEHNDNIDACVFSDDPVCDESQLMLLPCLHSACKPCIDHHTDQLDQGRPLCPCGKRIEVKADDLPVDYVRRNESAYNVSKGKKKTCTYKDHEQDVDAATYCQDCDDCLCLECKNTHDEIRKNRSHNRTRIQEMDTIPIQKWLKQETCQDHPKQELVLYDNTCKKPVCMVCSHGTHNQHDKEDLQLVHEKTSAELDKLLKNHQSKLQAISDIANAGEDHQTQLSQTAVDLETQVVSVHQDVAGIFLHRQKQLLQDVRLSLEGPNQAVQEKLKSVRVVEQAFKSTIYYIRKMMESTTKTELISLRDAVQKKASEDLKIELPTDDTRDTRVRLSFQGRKALEEIIEDFGSLATCTGINELTDSQPTIKDLRREMNGLTEKLTLTNGELQRSREEVNGLTEKLTLTNGELKKTREDLTEHKERLQFSCSYLEQVLSVPVSIASVIEGEAVRCRIVSSCEVRYYSVAAVGAEAVQCCLVSCPAMTLDTDRVNRKFHVSEDGLELENTERRGQSQGDIGGFRKYRGTCSRLPIPLPPSPSTLTTPRYWETHTRVRVERVGWRALLEMGLSLEGEVDTHMWVSAQTRNSWAVWVGVCGTHGAGVCTRVYRDGERVGECCTNTMSNIPGTTAVLHYGVVLDVGRGRLTFLDLDRGIVLSSFNVQFTESLRPMFSVCDWPSFYTVTMRLVSGAEITMTDTKKDLICQALSTT